MRLAIWPILISLILVAGCARNRVIHDFSVNTGQSSQEMPDGRANAPLTADGVRTWWATSDNGISFRLENLHADTISVVWDRSVIIDPQGVAHQVIHSGVPFIARHQPQTPSIVPAGSSLMDTVAPKDGVTWMGSRWTTSPLFSGRLAVGDTVRVVLALEAEGKEIQSEYVIRLSGVRCEIHDAPLNKLLVVSQPCT